MRKQGTESNLRGFVGMGRGKKNNLESAKSAKRISWLLLSAPELRKAAASGRAPGWCGRA